MYGKYNFTAWCSQTWFPFLWRKEDTVVADDTERSSFCPMREKKIFKWVQEWNLPSQNIRHCHQVTGHYSRWQVFGNGAGHCHLSCRSMVPVELMAWLYRIWCEETKALVLNQLWGRQRTQASLCADGRSVVCPFTQPLMSRWWSLSTSKVLQEFIGMSSVASFQLSQRGCMCLAKVSIGSAHKGWLLP